MKKFNLIFGLVIILMSGLVFAGTPSITDNFGNTNNAVRGTVLITVTVPDLSANETESVLFQWINGTSGLQEYIGQNLTENLTTYTMSWDTTASFTAISGTLNVSIVDIGEAGVNSTNSTTLTMELDNTAPINMILTLGSDLVSVGGNVGLTCTTSSDNVDTDLTFSYTIIQPTGDIVTPGATVLVENGNKGTSEIRGIGEVPITGEYTVNCSAVDNALNGVATTLNFFSSGVSDDGKPISTTTQETSQRGKIALIGVFIILVILVLLIIGFYMIKK